MWIGMRTSARMWRSTSRRAHYVREHGVWLPARFVEHVRAMRIQLEEMPWTTLGGAAKHPGTEQSTPCQAKRPAGDCAGPFRCRLGSGCAGFGGVVGRVLVGEGLDGFAADRAAELAVADLGRLGLLLGGAVGRRAPVRERDVLAGRPDVGGEYLYLITIPSWVSCCSYVSAGSVSTASQAAAEALAPMSAVAVFLSLASWISRIAGYAMMPSPTTIASTTIRIVRRLSALAWSRCIFSISSRRDCF